MKMDFDKIIITKLLSMVVVHSPKGRIDKTVDRPCYALSFTTDGQITYTHRGKSFISDNQSAVILPKVQTYDIKGDRDGIFPVINFECENFSADTLTVFPVKNMNAVMKDYELLKNAFFSGKKTLPSVVSGQEAAATAVPSASARVKCRSAGVEPTVQLYFTVKPAGSGSRV